MNTRSMIVAAALGLLAITGTGVAADAATVTKTKTVAVHQSMRPVVANKALAHKTFAKKTVIAHRFHRPLRHLAAVRVLPGHRIAPRIHLAHAVTKKVTKTTVIR